ncbi:hypothetical protein [Pseudonocardia sp. ICBG162]|uniref:hypothetical protein n=1 Tax=Pseudonocardia sp. ICBG162 TaxID=2846761 RepID=UPI001CF68980|nr:hypothetical protein [Pseudonocardia sp. ICBG162]
MVQLTVLAVLPPQRRPLAFASDDLYYYLLTALNWSDGLGPTFDGITPTNGYQPLWFWILSAAYLPVSDRGDALVVTMVLLTLLWVGAVYLLYRIASVLGAGYGSTAGLVALLVHSRWWGGCENAVATVLLLGLVLLVLRGRLLTARPPGRRILAGTGVLLACLVLARLDLLVVVAGVALLVARGTWGRPVSVWLRTFVPLLAPTAVTFGLYLVLNHLWFGTAVPVSGLAKQLGPRGANGRVVVDFLLYGQVGPLPMFFGATVLLASACAVLLLAPGRAERVVGLRAEYARPLRALVVLLCAASVVQVGYYAVATSWELQSWYFSCGVVALVLSAGVIGNAVVRGAGSRALVVALVVAALGAVVLNQGRVLGELPTSVSPATRDIDAGAWADAHLPPGAVIAMGDWAGTFAYSTRHPVVQTEGLVGSVDYLRALQAGTAGEWLADRGVGYLARLTHPGETVGCRVEEPYFGTGPRVGLDVCAAPPLYRGEVTGLGTLYIWSLAPGSHQS